MRDLEPAAAISDLPQIGHRRCHKLRNPQARVVGEADQRGLGWQRLLVAEPQDAVDPGNAGKSARKGGWFCRRARFRALGQPAQIVDKRFRIGRNRGGDWTPLLAPGEEAFEVGGDCRLGRRRHRRDGRFQRERVCMARIDQQGMTAQHQFDRRRKWPVSRHARAWFERLSRAPFWPKPAIPASPILP